MKRILNNKRTSWGIIIPHLKLYYREIMIKTASYLNRGGLLNQWNRYEDPEINPHTYGYLIFDREAKIYNGKKESIFNKRC